MTLLDIRHHYSTDERCRALLRRLRWPHGIVCPRCQSKTVFPLTDRQQFECGKCGYQFSVTARTIFGDTHLPLDVWFSAVLLLVEARKGFSANQMTRTLGVSYKTAWYLCHRIRHSMKEVSQPKLGKKVEMDETYVGGYVRGRRGRGAANKEIVVVIRQRGGDVRFFHAPDIRAGTLEKYIRQNVSEDVEVFITDELRAYGRAAKFLGARHRTIHHGNRVYVDGPIHTNNAESAFSLLKRGIVGTWHKISAKHLASYLNEMEFRFNRRKNNDLFVDTLRHMITTPTLTFKNLTA